MFAKSGMSEKERFDFFYNMIQENGNIFYAGKMLQKSFEKFPDNVALVYKDRFVTYKELYYRACQFSEKLKEHGVGSSDIVLLFFRNSFEFYVSYFGVWQVGAVVAPLNIFLKEHELQHIVNDSQAKVAVVDVKHKDMFASFDLKILTQDDIDLDSDVPEKISEFTIDQIDSERMAALLYTSGTTGLPKGVMLSSKNIMTNVVQAFARMPFSESKKIYCVLPLFHCFAQNTCVWTALCAGCTVIVVPKISRKEMLHGLKYKPEIFLGVPALFGVLCLLKHAPLGSVEYFISGGDALPDKIRAAFALVYGRKLCNGYGLTETSPLISVDLEDLTEPTNNIGKPVIGLKCVIKDEAGTVLPHGAIGELWVKGDNVMMGYYNEKKKTDEVLVDGWFATGDLAKFDVRGKLIICGRLKDVIIHKGMNIYPQEIENVILKHQNVLRVAVVGKGDNVSGDIPVAFVQLRSSVENVEQALRSICEKELAVYKIPRKFFIVKEMPLTATGKVNKKKLKEKIGVDYV